MRRVHDRIVAAVLCITLASFGSVAGYSAEPGTPAPLASLLAPAASARLAAAGHGAGALQPQSVATQIGRVAWKDLGAAEPSWSCRTGEGSSVSLDLGATGRITIQERSSVNLRSESDALVVTLLGGAVAFEPREARGARIETYDAVYRPEPGTGTLRVAWRAGSSSAIGETRREAAPDAEFLRAAGVELRSVEPRVKLAAGRSQPVAVVMTDAAGEPLAGVPVQFSTGPVPGGARAARLALAGGTTARALTGPDGVAATSATPLGAGETAISATVAGLPAAAVPADVARTSSRQKVVGLVVLGVLAAVTIALVVRAAGEDDPVLVPGPPTLVR